MTLHDIAARLRAAGLPERAAQIEALGLDLATEAPVVEALGGLVTEVEALRRRVERLSARGRT